MNRKHLIILACGAVAVTAVLLYAHARRAVPYAISCPGKVVTRTARQTLCALEYGRHASVLALPAKFSDVRMHLGADTEVLGEKSLSGSRALIIRTRGVEGKQLLVVHAGIYYDVSSDTDTPEDDQIIDSFRFLNAIQ